MMDRPVRTRLTVIAFAVALVACATGTRETANGTGVLSATPAVAFATAAVSSCSDPATRDAVKCSTPPPGYTAPPSPRRYPVTTEQELLAGLKTDPFVSSAAQYGDPVLIRAARANQLDEWLVPLLDGKGVGGIVVIPIFPDGTGSAGIWTGWSGRFPHALSPQEALAVASTGADPARTAELRWAVVDPRSGGPASETAPFYLVTRASGTHVLVMQNANVVDAKVIGVVP